MLGQVAARLQLREWAGVQRALTTVEAEWGKQHPMVGECLRVLAKLAQEQGEAVTSEGLFRTSVSRANQNRRTPLTEQLLQRARADYAYLLCHLEWNHQPRCREAALVLEEPRPAPALPNPRPVRPAALEAAKGGSAALLVAELEKEEAAGVDWWVTLRYGL